MLMILIAICAASICAAALFWTSERGYDTRHGVAFVFGLLFAIGAGLTAVAYAFAGWSWFAAEHEARIINREYGTHYTQAEVFWASDVIDTVRELDRKRVEVNGDVMRDVPDKRR